MAQPTPATSERHNYCTSHASHILLKYTTGCVFIQTMLLIFIWPAIIAIRLALTRCLYDLWLVLTAALSVTPPAIRRKQLPGSSAQLNNQRDHSEVYTSLEISPGLHMLISALSTSPSSAPKRLRGSYTAFMASRVYAWRTIMFYSCSFISFSNAILGGHQRTQLCHMLGNEPDLKKKIFKIRSFSPKTWAQNCPFSSSSSFLFVHKTIS